MIEKLQRRPAAWAIALCAVVLASLLGGRASLLRLRGEAAAVFHGTDTDSAYQSIDYALGEIVSDCRNLLVVAGRYTGAGDALVTQVEQAVERLEGAGSPAARHAAAQQLYGAVDDLDALLWTMDLSDSDRTYHRRLAANIDGRYLTIEQNGLYNDAATAFNGVLHSQPARLIASLTGVRPLELYA